MEECLSWTLNNMYTSKYIAKGFVSFTVFIIFNSQIAIIKCHSRLPSLSLCLTSFRPVSLRNKQKSCMCMSSSRWKACCGLNALKMLNCPKLEHELSYLNTTFFFPFVFISLYIEWPLTTPKIFFFEKFRNFSFRADRKNWWFCSYVGSNVPCADLEYCCCCCCCCDCCDFRSLCFSLLSATIPMGWLKPT